jgi:death-on-curing family protein
MPMITVKEIAQEAGRDTDEVLIILWECGLNYLNGPNSRIHGGNLKLAQKALGIPTRNEIISLIYWEKRLNKSGNEIQQILKKEGIDNSLFLFRLPKDAIKILKRQKVELSPPPPICKKENSAERTRESAKLPELTWRIIGHKTDIKYLTVENVIAIHFALENDFRDTADPITPPGIKDKTILGSSLFRMKTRLGSEEKYPTIEMAIAALTHSLVQNHPFHNGNKRTALVAMITMLDLNGLFLECQEDDLFKIILRLAQHNLVFSKSRSELHDLEVLELAEWIKQHTRWVEKGERPIQWRKLRRILNAYDCEDVFPSGVGNRINITRKISINHKGRTQTTIKKTQVSYRDDGADVEVDTIKKIRADLELDENHGIDSIKFYGGDPSLHEDFIQKYRKLLKRLARL